MEENNELNLAAIKATPKIGNEYLTYNKKSVGYSLLEFWQWSVSDILNNTTRGKFAEFIVGTAMEMNPKKLRDGWDAFDITTDNGIKMEIKSAAYIQSWNQKNIQLFHFQSEKQNIGMQTAEYSGMRQKDTLTCMFSVCSRRRTKKLLIH